MWERWLSGRKRTTRNRLIGKTIRGFESHPLRFFEKKGVALKCHKVRINMPFQGNFINSQKLVPPSVISLRFFSLKTF